MHEERGRACLARAVIQWYHERFGYTVQTVSEREPFRFGPGERIFSDHAVLIPCQWGQHTVILRISVVDRDDPRSWPRE